MGIKTLKCNMAHCHVSLKNFPTTWGLRLIGFQFFGSLCDALKSLPTTWGLRRIFVGIVAVQCHSEKPPHHSGIIQR